jgi:carbon storage regulator
MLILTRKKNEAIVIGDVIFIKVLAIDKETVRLGIEAPKSIHIFREELSGKVVLHKNTGREAEVSLGGETTKPPAPEPK